MLRPQVTGTERARLKAAIDARRRQLVLRGPARGACVECGGEFDEQTYGCRACHSRAQNRRYRQQKRSPRP